MKNKTTTAAIVEEMPDIRSRMQTTLSQLQDAVNESDTRLIKNSSIHERWVSRVERANGIVEQTSGEGQEAAKMLLAQAEEFAGNYSRILADENEHRELLQTQFESLQESVNKLDAFNRVQMLQERIKSIAPARPAVTVGDGERSGFDTREIEQNIHMINALIELKKES
jgi:hypothetical protein